MTTEMDDALEVKGISKVESIELNQDAMSPLPELKSTISVPVMGSKQVATTEQAIAHVISEDDETSGD